MFDMPVFHSADFVDVKSVPIVITGDKKNNFIVVLSYLSSGHKLAPNVIFKKKKYLKKTSLRE